MLMVVEVGGDERKVTKKKGSQDEVAGSALLRLALLGPYHNTINALPKRPPSQETLQKSFAHWSRDSYGF